MYSFTSKTSDEVLSQVPVCPWPLPDVSREDLIAEQRVDSSLTPLFSLVSSYGNIQEYDTGYFVFDGVLSGSGPAQLTVL